MQFIEKNKEMFLLIFKYIGLHSKLTFRFTFTGSKQAFIQFLPDQQPNLL
jgi:hypothetical protein